MKGKKNTKGSKGTKSTKSTKGTKGSKGTKATQATKVTQSTKGTKGTQVAKKATQDKKEKKAVFSPRFNKIYVMIMAPLFVCAAIGLGVFWFFLAEHEKTMPDYTAIKVFEQYFKTVDYDALYELEKHNLSELETFDNYVSYLKAKTEPGEISFRTVPTGVPDTKKYNVFSDGLKFAEFELTAAEVSGAQRWELSGINTLLDKGLLTVEILDGSTLYINDSEIGDGYLTATGIRRPEADRLNMKYNRYQMTSNLGVTAMTVVDKAGREGAIAGGAGLKYVQEIIYDDALFAKFGSLAADAATTYAKYMTNNAKLSDLRVFFETGTATYEALRRSEVHWYTDHIANWFENIVASEFFDHGGGTFSCRVTLDQYIKRTETDTKLFPLDITLFFRKTDDKFLVFELIGNAL